MTASCSPSPRPSAALEFAVAVQDDLATSAVAGEEGISVRMGLNTGEAIAEEGDLFGRSVVLAARIAAQARGGEILVSEELATRCRERTPTTGSTTAASSSSRAWPEPTRCSTSIAQTEQQQMSAA